MDFDRLYSLSCALKRNALHVSAPYLAGTSEALSLLRGDSYPGHPVVFRRASGSTPMDILGTDFGFLFLISSKVAEVFRSHGFSGWSAYPVEVFGKGGEVLQGYVGLAVTGRCGPFDRDKSPLVEREPRISGGPVRQVHLGLYFSPDTWDGSDIFLADTTARVIVTKAVKDALQKARISNAILEPLTQIESL